MEVQIDTLFLQLSFHFCLPTDFFIARRDGDDDDMRNFKENK